MKNFNTLAVITFLLLLPFASSAAGAQPNIVHIIADDLGWSDVGFHGSEIKTPVIDRLAAESVVLDRFYVTPICSPTRAGMLTGRYPFRFGIWGGVCNPLARHGLPPGETTTAELLARHGYAHRGLFGKWHLGLSSTMFHPLQHGFSHFYGHYNGAIDYFSRERFRQLDWHRNFESVREDGYSTDLLGQAAVQFIDTHSHDGPFYMVVAFNAPHSPIQAKREDLKQYGFDTDGPRASNTDRNIAVREKAPEYGEAGKGNSVRQTYSAMVSSLDGNLGHILEALDRQGIRENTLVIFHSDNGADPKHGGNNKPLRGTKFTTWEGGVRVVAMISWPARLKASSYESVAAYIDILPTLAAASGCDVPTDVDGVNLLPFLEGKQPPPERSLLLGRDTFVTDRWKLKGGKLFDLQNDPNEKVPVPNPPVEVVARLGRDLARFGEAVGPPTKTSLPVPPAWPPEEWKLPAEPQLGEVK